MFYKDLCYFNQIRSNALVKKVRMGTKVIEVRDGTNRYTATARPIDAKKSNQYIPLNFLSIVENFHEDNVPLRIKKLGLFSLAFGSLFRITFYISIE